MKTKAKITRKDTREHMAQLHLACELVKVIRHYFPGHLSMLKGLDNPRHQSYITYESHILLMTRILSSIFYISSMRKTSQEFNSYTVIQNVGYLCGKQELSELPYWETINDYLKELDPKSLYRTHRKGAPEEYREYSIKNNFTRQSYRSRYIIEKFISQWYNENIKYFDRVEFAEQEGLYEKMGFRIIGVRPNTIRLKDGILLNEYLMTREIKR